MKVTFVFDGDKCISNALDFSLKFRTEVPKVKNKTVANNLRIHAHKGSSFNTWIVFNILLCDKYKVDIKKNGGGIDCLKVSVGYILNNKKQISSLSSF